MVLRTGMQRNFANLGHELARVAASGTTSEGLTVRRGQRQHLTKSVVFSLEELNAQLKVLEMGSTTSTECTLNVTSTIRRQVVVALTATLGGGDGRDV